MTDPTAPSWFARHKVLVGLAVVLVIGAAAANGAQRSSGTEPRGGQPTATSGAAADRPASSAPVATTSRPSPPAETAPAAPSPVATTAAPPSAEPTFTMPVLVGMNLQLAQDTLQAMGSYLMDQQDASGLGRLQVLDSNWRVCSQDPAAGAVVPISTIVTLASVKLDEACR